jgi:hypothetical protein
VNDRAKKFSPGDAKDDRRGIFDSSRSIHSLLADAGRKKSGRFGRFP